MSSDAEKSLNLDRCNGWVAVYVEWSEFPKIEYEEKPRTYVLHDACYTRVVPSFRM